MQHLSVLTSKRNQLHDEVHQWRRNGVGLEFNHLFGYGVLDAGGMVKMAKEWKTVPERFHCVAGSIQEIQWVTPLLTSAPFVLDTLHVTSASYTWCTMERRHCWAHETSSSNYWAIPVRPNLIMHLGWECPLHNPAILRLLAQPV